MSRELEFAAYSNNLNRFISLFNESKYDNENLCEIYYKCIKLFCKDVILFLKDRVLHDEDTLKKTIRELFMVSSLEINKFLFEHFCEYIKENLFTCFIDSFKSFDESYIWYYEKFNTVLDIAIESNNTCLFYESVNYGNTRAIFWLFDNGFKPKNPLFYLFLDQDFEETVLWYVNKTLDDVNYEILCYICTHQTDSDYEIPSKIF